VWKKDPISNLRELKVEKPELNTAKSYFGVHRDHQKESFQP
jgi:hypothetical protein